ncbi:MAG: hypothetical protein ACR2MD_08145 [Aridibacter sp.]
MIGLRWRWLVLEAEVKTDDILFFGFVAGDAHELGYFTERELLGVEVVLEQKATLCV